MFVKALLNLFEVSVSTSVIIILLWIFSSKINQRYAVKWKYYIWLVLAIRLIIPVNVSLPLISSQIIIPDSQTGYKTMDNKATDVAINSACIVNNNTDVSYSEIPSTISSNTAQTPIIFLRPIEIIEIIWLIGFAVFILCHLLVYLIYKNELVKYGKSPAKKNIQKQIVQIGSELNLHRNVRVIVSKTCESPMLIGIINPILAIPCVNYCNSDFEMIIRHELTHCKRNDILFKVFLTIVNAVHWFNPFVYIMSYEASADVELCCDADVLSNANFYLRKNYSESIIASMEGIKHSLPMSTCFSHGGVHRMKERFKNIFNTQKKHNGIFLFAVIIVMSILLGSLVACTTGRNADADEPHYASMTDISENILPINESVDCDLINMENISDVAYPLEGDYLTLHQALYCINYAHSQIYYESLKMPEEERGESVYEFPYSDYTVETCTYFGNGVPCQEWQNNHWHSLPFHSDYEDFFASEPRPAWGIVVKYPLNEMNATEIIYVDAQTGDMYNSTNSGGYYPSPYIDRSMYARLTLDGEQESTIITEDNSEYTNNHKDDTATRNNTSLLSETTSTHKSFSEQDLVLIRDYLPNVYVDLKYATTDNFTGKIIYNFVEPSLRYGTVKKLIAVQDELNNLGYSLKIWDAYRPLSAHYKLWEICPNPTYVSDPSTGNLSHCRGNAIDVTIVLINGNEIDVPTGFDDFTDLADRDYSDVSVKAGENAVLLQNVMEKHGFKGYSGEWWHYSDTVNYKVVK